MNNFGNPSVVNVIDVRLIVLYQIVLIMFFKFYLYFTSAYSDMFTAFYVCMCLILLCCYDCAFYWRPLESCSTEL